MPGVAFVGDALVGEGVTFAFLDSLGQNSEALAAADTAYDPTKPIARDTSHDADLPRVKQQIPHVGLAVHMERDPYKYSYVVIYTL